MTKSYRQAQRDYQQECLPTCLLPERLQNAWDISRVTPRAAPGAITSLRGECRNESLRAVRRMALKGQLIMLYCDYGQFYRELKAHMHTMRPPLAAPHYRHAKSVPRMPFEVLESRAGAQYATGVEG